MIKTPSTSWRRPLNIEAQETRSEFILRLFEAYYDRVYAFTRQSTTCDVAEDIAQETFLRLLQHPRLEEITLSASYLIKTAQNLLYRRYSRSVRLRELLATKVTDDAIQRQEQRSLQQTNRTALRADTNQIAEALASLSPKESATIRLTVCDGKSYEQAARSLNTNVTTINNWKHRGIAKLQQYADRTLACADTNQETACAAG